MAVQKPIVKTETKPVGTNIPPVAKNQAISKESENLLNEEALDNVVPLEVKNTKLHIFGIVASTVIVTLTVALVVVRFKFINEPKNEIVQIEEIQVEEELEVVQLKREEISIEILNGSGVSGLAGETAKVFEDLGYENIEVGNTDEVVGNQLFVRIDKKLVVKVLLEDVLSELNIDSITGDLPESEEIYARIILGS